MLADGGCVCAEMNFFDGVEGFGIQELLERVGSGNEGEFMEVRWQLVRSAVVSQHVVLVAVQHKPCVSSSIAAARARLTLGQYEQH